ncbi:50S ribosomal subunit protein L21 [Candidatus Blochmanniella floridana]|uniref:Large ribosomal subunit protein bL21 n=1 Tax=Blochmanniella floridana TaxID=203907 RepID=RL21_BLOFL|nr:RecName: Full=Large ribosomal subunit protein bL21; AltName: Full=50S ribosomal protein L21 [Candidatus Blochmannia floridanus]CAD83616.1 50S ribosomal subunit protein L21 [Candidatus Blochmannia floridanus]
MYAVFQIGSKQYYVRTGQVIFIDRVKLDIGNQIEFNQVLLIRDMKNIYIGNPFIQNGKIIADILDHSLGKKIRIVKFRRRKHFRKFQGHRQCMTKIKVVKINSNNSDIECYKSVDIETKIGEEVHGA